MAWVGAAQIIGMYLLLSFDYIKPRKIYHFFNATGAAFVCIVCISGQVWQAAIVEGVWSIMATFFFFRTVIKTKEYENEDAQTYHLQGEIAKLAFERWLETGNDEIENWIWAKEEFKRRTKKSDKL